MGVVGRRIVGRGTGRGARSTAGRWWRESGVRGGFAVVLLLGGGCVEAASYRCEDAGRVTYSDLPCPGGRQTEVVPAPAPSAADRAAAVARQRADRDALADIERQRALERTQDERAAALAARRQAGAGKAARACQRLALRARRAHDDFDVAGPRDQPIRRLRALRADQDYAAQCGKR